MKTLAKLLIIIMLLPVFMACNNHDQMDYPSNNYHIDIATVKNSDLSSQFSFLLDNNRLMKITYTDLPLFIPKDGQRIIANYSFLSVMLADSTLSNNVRLNNANTVLTKSILKITPATQDSIGHDSITIKDMWIGNDFLNIEFAYLGNDKTHFINLVSDASKVYTDGKIHLEFRHNANGDKPAYYYSGIVSFNLKSLQNGVTANVLNLLIHVNVPYQAAERLYNITYYFGPTVQNYYTPVFPTPLQEIRNYH